MRILIISATALEVGYISKSPIIAGELTSMKDFFNKDVDLLVSGVGAVPTAFHTAMNANSYQLVVNVGIAGSYRSEIPMGSVTCVVEDAFGDYGIDDRGIFKSLYESKLIDEKGNPFHGDILKNPFLKDFIIPEDVKKVRGITLGTATGSIDRLTCIENRWNPDIETMESAAIFYVCNMLKVPFICFRAISNIVEPRDRSKWMIRSAIENLSSITRCFINDIH